MAKRVQSPSSIKTYKQCPRKYYYQYIAKLPTAENIHTIRGTIAHSVLEDFFNIDASTLDTQTAEENFRREIQELLIKHWTSAKERFAVIGIEQHTQAQYFEETLFMLMGWLVNFMTKLKELNEPLPQAFTHLTPVREQHFESEEHAVRGFIDAIETVNGTIRIMDYKTSSGFNLDEHKLQLAIYSLLYFEKHNHLPHYAGVYFLKGPEKTIPVDHELVNYAKQEIAFVHEHTESEEKHQYPLKMSRLCKWSTGACDFYDHCFNGKAVLADGQQATADSGRLTTEGERKNTEDLVQLRTSITN